MDCLMDFRGNCMSVIFTVSFPQYEELINCAYKNRGGIEGQRGALKSSTAIRIRKRMVDDIASGTVLPPVVIGAAIEGIDYQAFSKKSEDELIQWLIENAEDLSLIDGMQRTTAMFEAAKSATLSDYKIRVELWLAQNVNNLIYRMLVLNSGQVPWDVRRQLETVFSSVLKQIQHDVPDISIFNIDDGRRRRSAKQYQSSNILEMYFYAFALHMAFLFHPQNTVANADVLFYKQRPWNIAKSSSMFSICTWSCYPRRNC